MIGTSLNKHALEKQYRELLMDGIVPFWMRHGVDHEHGGILSCMTEDGTPISSDKFISSQARFARRCSSLYNLVEARRYFLECARNPLEFLLAHGRDDRG